MPQTSSLIGTYRALDTLTTSSIYEFQKPIHKNRFFNNKDFLIDTADYIKFTNKKWHLRPEFFSQDHYGVAELFRIILVVNEITSRFNFRSEFFEKYGIIAPTIGAIRSVLSQNMQ